MPKFKITINIKGQVNGFEEEREGVIEVDSTTTLHNAVCEMTKSMIHRVLEKIKKEYPDTL